MGNGIQGFSYRPEVGLPFEAAVERVTAEPKEEGFGVLSEIDVQLTLKKKLDVDIQPYVILGACNPSLAHRALQEELEVGLLLPCNVIVYEVPEGSVISIVDPVPMLGVTGNPDLQPVAEDARALVARVVAALHE